MNDNEKYDLISYANQLCDDMVDVLCLNDPPIFSFEKHTSVRDNVDKLRLLLEKADPQYAIKHLHGGFGGGV